MKKLSKSEDFLDFYQIKLVLIIFYAWICSFIKIKFRSFKLRLSDGYIFKFLRLTKLVEVKLNMQKYAAQWATQFLLRRFFVLVDSFGWKSILVAVT